MNKPHIQQVDSGWLVWDHLDAGRFFLCEDWDSVTVLTEAMIATPFTLAASLFDPESHSLH